MPIHPGFFLTSVLSVRENAVKNILFRAATLLLQLTVYKVFSYVTFKSNAYTSFLMFAEDIMQRIHYVFSRGLTRGAFMVVAFTAIFTVAGFYDTLLWALDSPGYVTRSSMVNAGSVAHQLLDNPGYTILVSDPAQNVDSIDVDQGLTGNLFKTGFNFSLPGAITPGSRDIVPTNRSLSETGPRIWLDDAGFSVSVDQTTMISPTDTVADFCNTITLDENRQVWRCVVNNTQAMSMLSAGIAGQPEIWWDTRELGSEFLTPNRRENPWQSLGTGGDTAVMKQVFTVTKGRRRHTFLETAIKVSMLTLYPTPFNETEITDMVRRMWSDDPSQPITSDVQQLADLVVSAQTNQTSLTFGALLQANYSVGSLSTELLNVVGPPNLNVSGERLYSVLRTTSTNITLIRSETLFEPVIPFAACPGLFYTNLATGGRVRSTTCHKSLGNQTGAHFQGQLDTSAMLILTDVLGDGSTPTSATALNQTGVEWFNRNNDHLDQLLMSRGLILGGDRTAVAVEVKHNEAALSYLQLLLVVLPVLLAFAAWILVWSGPTSYYQASFLAAVCATTHVGGSKCKKVGYLHEPPEISLSTVGDHVLIRTPSGVLTNVGTQGESAYIMTAEPLLMKEGSSTPNIEGREQWRGE